MSSKGYAVGPGWGAMLVDLGIEPRHVLRRAGLPDDLFAREGVWLSGGEYFGFWRALEQEADDPLLPIHFGQVLSVETFEPTLFAALCSRDLALAARRIAQYKRLIGPMRLQVVEDAAGLSLTYRWPDDEAPPPLLAATELLFWVALARIATRSRVCPLRLELPNPPQPAQPYCDYFGVGIGQGNRQAITFSPQDAHHPFLTTNEGMWRFFEPELRRRLSQLQGDAAMAERVHGLLLEMLPAGQSAIETVADRLAISPRTLQRRLKKEGATFQGVLGRTRELLARHYLSCSHMSSAEISFLLGYEDPNSFFRAFRDWTGRTPEQVRRDEASRGG